jgi:hypothetical protein
VDIAKGEATEKELDTLIRRRHDQRVQTEGERLEAELWTESVKKHNARQQADLRLQWREHFRRMRAVHYGLGDEYDAKLRKLENGHRKETA